MYHVPQNISRLLTVRSDWLDESTYDNPFEHSSIKGEKVSAVYIVMPENEDPVTPSNTFIDYALKNNGVKRFVLFSGTTAEKGGPVPGKIWEHLDQIGVEYCVLRASWLMGKVHVLIAKSLRLTNLQKTLLNGNTPPQSRTRVKSTRPAGTERCPLSVLMILLPWRFMR